MENRPISTRSISIVIHRKNKFDLDVNEVDPRLRRYEHLAWLIHGDDKCGATYFDDKEEYLCLATNNSNSPHYPLIKDYLITTAKISEQFIQNLRYASLDSSANKEEINERIIQFLSNRIREIAALIDQANEQIRLFSTISFFSDFIQSCFKVTFSIIHGYLKNEFTDFAQPENRHEAVKKIDEVAKIAANNLCMKINNFRGIDNEIKKRMCRKVIYMFSTMETWIKPHANLCKNRAFDENLIDALSKGRVKLLGDKERDLHAELKIIQKIITENNILDTKGNINRGVINDLPSYYIGVSKKCCLNCECTIRAVNEVLKEHGKKDDFIVLRTLKGSAKRFPAPVPDFLVDTAFTEKFLRIRQHGNLEKAFKQAEKKLVPGDCQKQRRSRGSRGSNDSAPRNKRHKRRSKQRHYEGYANAGIFGRASFKQDSQRRDRPRTQLPQEKTIEKEMPHPTGPRRGNR